MCMIDDGIFDFVEPIKAQWRTARTQHQCAECRRVIGRGERYHSDRYKFDGEFVHHKCCEHCDVVRQWLNDECGGWAYTCIEEDIREHLVDGRYPVAVFRLAVGMQWKWRSPSGRMLPVPTVPMTTSGCIEDQQGVNHE